ncbi:hypothetical protein [Microbacterium sp.]|uniref:hypothetical protein n=1 Tax=Microbacterium sp. TaxID=51671 RepID=UPI0037CB51D5
MSTPEQPHGPGLTRKQLREIRMTGATPVMTPATSTEPEAAAPEAPPAPQPPAPAVHLPRPAEEPVTSPPPRPDAQVDLGVAPLTRRQAREQERIRTASVPVISPMTETTPPAPQTPAAQPAATWSPAPASAPVAERPAASPVSSPTVVAERDQEHESAPEPTDADIRPVVRPGFGATLLDSPEPAAPLPPSFDELIARGSSTTGSVATPNALILTPTGAPLTSPVTATGEVLITGTFALPDGLGSQGHAHGAADGKDVDAVLIDGELPAASSPTPIAASAAVSTVKGTGDMIRPPAPEKGGKLMLGLAVTAGVLAAALIGVLIVAFVTGVFS